MTMGPVRFSNLKHMARSPLHYHHAVTSEFHESRVMRVGYGVHGRVLGASPHVVYEGDRRGKAWEAFKAQYAGARILTSSEDADAKAIADAVLAHPRAAALMDGKRELEVGWEWLGRECMSHLDVLGDGRIVDLKITSAGPPEKFRWHALRMGWHAQLAFYRRAAAALGVKNPDCYLVAVEDKAPYAVTVRPLTPRALEAGDKLCRLWMERLLSCEGADHWPPYCESDLALDVEDEASFEVDGAEEMAA
jgi:hypothetical protein